ncbi:transcriptional regulator [Brucella suis bv. 3 str. 686]|nr:transcriptional regulator [Brucella suis bv. 3 str. 686]
MSQPPGPLPGAKQLPPASAAFSRIVSLRARSSPAPNCARIILPRNSRPAMCRCVKPSGGWRHRASPFPNRGAAYALPPSTLAKFAKWPKCAPRLRCLHCAMRPPHITRAVLDAAEQATLEGDKSRDVRSWEDANRRFHRLILTPCKMPRLLAAIDDLHAASARFLFATWRSAWEARTDHDHRAILAALRQNDIESAATILARHVQWIGHRPVKTASGKVRDSFAIVG